MRYANLHKNKLKRLYNILRHTGYLLLLLDEEYRQHLEAGTTLHTLKLFWKLRNATEDTLTNTAPIDTLKDIYTEINYEIKLYENLFKYKELNNNTALSFLQSYKDIYKLLQEILNIKDEEV